eukprot:scaffold895_cov315-Pinguiococcus_pyrenoidosus.AAC.6
MHGDVRIREPTEVLGVVVALVSADDDRSAAAHGRELSERPKRTDGHQEARSAALVVLREVVRVPRQDALQMRVVVALALVIVSTDRFVFVQVVEALDDLRVERVLFLCRFGTNADESLLEPLRVHLKDVMAKGVEQVVRHDADGILAGPSLEHGPARQMDLRVVHRVEDASFEVARVEVLLQPGVVAPEAEVRLGEVRHDVHNLGPGEVTDAGHLLQRFDHEIAELARSGAQLDDVQRLGGIQRARAACSTGGVRNIRQARHLPDCSGASAVPGFMQSRMKPCKTFAQKNREREREREREKE